VLQVIALVVVTLLIAGGVGTLTAILVMRTGSTANPSGGVAVKPTPTPNPAATQASALFRAAIQAGEQSAGFHYSAVTTFDGSTETVTGDSGQNDGTQTFDETTSYGDEQFDLVLTPNQTVYFEGNAPALEDQLGVSAASAAGLSGEWVSVQIGDGPYKDLEVGITVGSALSEVTLTASSTEPVTGAGGASLTRIEGAVPASDISPGGTGHIDISTGTDLPVSYTVSFSSGGSSTTTFSDWGTAPSPTAPSTSVAWSKLTTTAPPDGFGSGETPSPAPTPTPGAA
jgi:hypothetical protein